MVIMTIYTVRIRVELKTFLRKQTDLVLATIYNKIVQLGFSFVREYPQENRAIHMTTMVGFRPEAMI